MGKKQEERRKNIFIERINPRIKYQNELKKEILMNSSYMEWIIRFLNRHPLGFSDYDVCEDEFDNHNIQKLNILYSIIKDYVYKNYVAEFIDLNSYILKYGDCYLQIEESLVMHNLKYTVIKIRKTDKYIDFNDIKENKKDDYVDTNNDIIYELNQKIDKLYQKGLPIDYIKEIIDDIIYNIELQYQKEEKRKVLF